MDLRDKLFFSMDIEKPVAHKKKRNNKEKASFIKDLCRMVLQIRDSFQWKDLTHFEKERTKEITFRRIFFKSNDFGSKSRPPVFIRSEKTCLLFSLSKSFLSKLVREKWSN
jgi:uncharacterized protein YprB with RNaseH-like and TPR domain